MPPDLVRVLRDPTITIPLCHKITMADGRTLFEHLEEWRNASSNTASGLLPADVDSGQPEPAENMLLIEEMEARADALIEYGNALPDGVSTEAFAEAANLRREAAELRGAVDSGQPE